MIEDVDGLAVLNKIRLKLIHDAFVIFYMIPFCHHPKLRRFLPRTVMHNVSWCKIISPSNGRTSCVQTVKVQVWINTCCFRATDKPSGQPAGAWNRSRTRRWEKGKESTWYQKRKTKRFLIHFLCRFIPVGEVNDRADVHVFKNLRKEVRVMRGMLNVSQWVFALQLIIPSGRRLQFIALSMRNISQVVHNLDSEESPANTAESRINTNFPEHFHNAINNCIFEIVRIIFLWTTTLWEISRLE